MSRNGGIPLERLRLRMVRMNVSFEELHKATGMTMERLFYLSKLVEYARQYEAEIIANYLQCSVAYLRGRGNGENRIKRGYNRRENSECYK